MPLILWLMLAVGMVLAGVILRQAWRFNRIVLHRYYTDQPTGHGRADATNTGFRVRSVGGSRRLE